MIRKRLLIVAACSLAIFASVYAPAARAWTRQANQASAPSHPLDYPNVPPPDYYTGDPDIGHVNLLCVFFASGQYFWLAPGWSLSNRLALPVRTVPSSHSALESLVSRGVKNAR